MKVISGRFKGKKLFGPKNIRPVTSMIKEAIFNTLSWVDWGNTKILDIFCGAGNFGIEAISRGARYVVFVDKSKTSIDFVKKNLQGISWNGKFILDDFRLAIKKLFKKGLKFNIIFADPPFDLFLGEEIINTIEQNNLLTKEGVIILRVRDKEKINFSHLWDVKEKKYGDSVIYYLSMKDDNEEV